MKRAQIITSPRSFGVEFELSVPNGADNLNRALDRECRVERDGSLTCASPAEVVTGVLAGPEGAGYIIKYCNAMKAQEAHGKHESCGMHVHIGAKDFLNEKKYTVVDESGLESFKEKRKADILSMASITQRYLDVFKLKPVDKIIVDVCKAILDGRGWRDYGVLSGQSFIVKDVSDDENNKHLLTVPKEDYDFLIALAAKLTRDEAVKTHAIHHTGEISLDQLRRVFKKLDALDTTKKYHVACLQTTEPLERLKQLLCFYLAFERVILSMCAPSRRAGNSYCQPLADSYSIAEIMQCDNYNKLRDIWYKTSRDTGNKYNDSRYHAINLHSLWHRNGTIEIRCHGSTIDSGLVLAWTALHQRVVDKAGSLSFDIDLLNEASQIEDVSELVRVMLNVIEADDVMRAYVAKMLAHFSKITI